MQRRWALLMLLAGAGAAAWFVLAAGPPHAERAALDVGGAGAAPAAPAGGPGLKGSPNPSTTPDASRGGRYVVAGRVVDADGKGLAGIAVQVQLHRRGGTSERNDYRETQDASRAVLRQRADEILAGEDEAPREVAARAVSAEGGTFLVRLPLPGTYWVVAEPGPPWARASLPVSLHADMVEAADVTLTLRVGTRVAGRVQDAAGRPLVARVTVYSGGWSETVATTADGAFVVHHAPPGDVTLAVTLPRGRKVQPFKATVPTQDEVVLRIPAGRASVAGRVHATDGEGIAGAAVLLYFTAQDAVDGDKPQKFELAAETDAQGRYALDDLPPGRVEQVYAVADGFLPYLRYPGVEGWIPVPLEEGATATIDVALGRGSIVQGVVTHALGGTPIRGATVTLHDLGTQPPQMTSQVTDAEGRYTFEGMGAGRFLALAGHPGWFVPEIEAEAAPRYTADVDGPPGHLVVVLTTEERRVEQDLVLLPGRTVSGRVVDPSGQPVAGAGVLVRRHGLGHVASRWRMYLNREETPLATTDDTGHFVLPGLGPRTDWILFARHKGFAGSESAPVDVSQGDAEDVTLHLLPGCVLRGRVLDEAGAPLIGHGVYVGGATALRGGGWRFATDAEGAFEIDSLPAASIELSARRGNDTAILRINDLTPGEVREGLTLRYGLKAEVSGRVITSAGGPVPRVVVALSRMDGVAEWREATTAADGTFRIVDVEPGRVRLAIRGTEGTLLLRGEPFEAPASDKVVIHDVANQHTLRGTVLGVDGAPVPRCQVDVTAAGRRVGRTTAVVDGRFEVVADGEPPFQLGITQPTDAKGTPLNLQPVTVPVADPAVETTVRLAAGHVLAGRVVDDEGRGVMAVVVRITARRRTTTDAEGRWRLEGLGPEYTIVEVEPPAPFVAPPPRSLLPGGHETEFRLERGAAIAGQLVVPQGADVSGANVIVRWDAAPGREAGSKRAPLRGPGPFRIEGLPKDTRVALEATAWLRARDADRLAPATLTGIQTGRTDVEIVLGEGEVIAGVVVDDKGAPAAGLRVRSLTPGAAATTTDDRGAFRLTGLVPGPHLLVVLSEINRQLTSPVEARAPAVGVRLVLPAYGELSGRLVGAPEGVAWFLEVFDASQGDATSAPPMQGEVLSDGRWSVPRVARDRSWIVTMRDRSETSGWYAISQALASGATDVELRVQQGATLSGRTLRAGVPLSQCYVTATGRGWSRTARSDGEGMFQLRGLPPGTCDITARHTSLRLRGRAEAVPTTTADVPIEVDQPD